MKRLVRILSFAAGIAALIWAMRDRFISLALPREPEPPAFRHPDEHPHVPHRPHQAAHDTSDIVSDDLREIKGIGPVFASALTDLGITSFADLAAKEAGKLARSLNTSESRVSSWIDQAKQLS